MARTRRAYLAATAGVAGFAAGCLGGGGGGTGCDADPGPTVTDLPSPTLGPADAPVTVEAFEDFACPHCATFSLEVLPRLRSEFVDPGTVRYVHRDFPLPVDERWSWQVPSAARAVQDEADDATFFEYAHALFDNQDDYSPALLVDLADEVGAPGCAVEADARAETYRPVIEADRRVAVDRGAGGTPAVYVGGRAVRPTYDAVAAAVDAIR
jgi:protein-disulfide isomerase